MQPRGGWHTVHPALLRDERSVLAAISSIHIAENPIGH
jgi:hypothetical protein